MKKIIQVSLKDNFLNLKSDNKIITKIDLNNLTLSGNDLFNNFFKKINLSEKIEVEVVHKAQFKDINHERIFNDLKNVIHDIVDKINDTLFGGDTSK